MVGALLLHEIEPGLTASIASADPSVGLAIMAVGITTYACCLWLRQRMR